MNSLHANGWLLIIGLLLCLIQNSEAQESGAPKEAANASFAGARPAWATEVGKDQYGAWADLVVNQATQRLRWIPSGTFTMGSPKNEPDRDRDEVQHQVTISHGYWLGESEVTQAFWQNVMEGAPTGGDAQLPATTTWEDAQKFFAQLNTRKSGLGANFPTEAQWEYACRAGTTGPTYGPVDAVAWYLITSVDQYGNNLVHPVKQKQPNAWGLFDMLGNVWESTRDWYGEFPTGAVTDPSGPPSGNRHVVRGGSSRNAAGSCRAAWRWAEFPAAKGVGLRVMIPSSP